MVAFIVVSTFVAVGGFAFALGDAMNVLWNQRRANPVVPPPFV